MLLAIVAGVVAVANIVLAALGTEAEGAALGSGHALARPALHGAAPS